MALAVIQLFHTLWVLVTWKHHFEPKGLPLLLLFVALSFVFCLFVFFSVFFFERNSWLLKWSEIHWKCLQLQSQFVILSVHLKLGCDTIALHFIRWDFPAMHMDEPKSHENFDTVSSEVAQTSNEHSSLDKQRNNKK